MRRIISLSVLLPALLCCPLVCCADSSLSYRMGTLGFGLDYDLKLRESVTLRLGYNVYAMKRSVDHDGLQYNAALKVNSASAWVDWHFNASPWRLSTGVSQSGPFAEASGTPTGGTVTINGQTYSAAQLGTLDISVKFKNPVAPYVGIGWGRAIGSADRFGFLFDFGVLYTGSAKTRVDASCGAALAGTSCDQLIANIKAEAVTQEQKWHRLQVWPVIAVGFAMRWQ
jgi:hypothetical protein